jgi:hypothetical protein
LEDPAVSIFWEGKQVIQQNDGVGGGTEMGLGEEKQEKVASGKGDPKYLGERWKQNILWQERGNTFFLYPENGCSRNLRNTGNFIYKVLHYRRQQPYIYHLGNIWQCQ